MSRPFIPVPNTAQVELLYQVGGAIVENVFHVNKGSPYTAAELVTLVTAFDNWDNTNWKGQRGIACLLTRIVAKALDSLGSPIYEYSLPTARAGTQGGSTMPNNVTWCVKKATGLTGRSYRGRIYLPPFTISNLQTGAQLVTTAFASAVISALTTLKTTLASSSQTLVVVSYRSNGAWRAEGVATPITSFVYTDLVCDSQRRRLQGRGI